MLENYPWINYLHQYFSLVLSNVSEVSNGKWLFKYKIIEIRGGKSLQTQ
jgi:hypothetical protein